MTHPLLTINWKRYLLVTGAVILIGLIWSYFLSYNTQDARNVANAFMKSAIGKETDDLSQYLRDKNLYFENLQAFSDINQYNECGFGTDADGSASIHYFVTGLPADNRNIDLKLGREGSVWRITHIHINYHILREDKALALQVAEWIANRDEKNLMPYLTEDVISIMDPVYQACRNERLSLRKTETRPAGKNEGNTRRTNFFFSNADETKQLSFMIKYQHNYSVEEISLK